MENEILNSKLATLKINYEFAKFQKKMKKGAIVQSLLFAKDKFTVATAIAWAKKKGFRSSKVDVPKTGNNIRLRQKEPGRFTAFRTIVFGKGVKAIIAANNLSKFAGQMFLSDISKFSAIKSDLDITIPMPVEFHILCEGQNRDGFIMKEDLAESLDLWANIPVIDFHDKSKVPTEYKMSDRQGHAFGKPYIKVIDGKNWIIVPGEITNRDMAYQAYIMNERGNPLGVSAEFRWNKMIMDGTIYQTNIKPHMISIVDKGHLEGSKLAIMAS